jgi:transposase
MARPPAHSVDFKTRVVLGVLSGELSAAEAARRHGVSETSVAKWKQQFIEAGRAGLGRERRGPSGRELRLQAQVDELARALGEAHVRLRLAERDGGAAGLPSPSWR